MIGNDRQVGAALLLALAVAACGGGGSGALAGPSSEAPQGPDSDSDPAGVGETAAPRITALSPDPLREGEPATISGSGFAPTAAGNAVTVDGRTATVLAATATELRVRVPAFACEPPRRTAVQVSTSGGRGSRTAVLESAGPPLALAVGEQRLIRAGEEPCLRFAETAGDEAYLVGVQSVSDVAGGLSRVEIVGSSAAPAAGASVATGFGIGTRAGGRAGVGRSGGPGGTAGAGRPLPRSSDREAHLSAESRIRAWEAERLPRRGSAASPGGGVGHADPRSEAEGPAAVALMSGRDVRVSDVVRLRVPDVRTGMCERFEEVDAVVRAVGERSVWLEDVDNPAGGFEASDYRALRDLVDRDVWEYEADYFGSPTDLDGNGRIAVVVTGRLNRMDPGLQGFVFAGDLYDRADCPSSDAGEVFYAKAPDPSGTLGPAWSAADARAVTPLVLVHELAHLIQMGRRIRAGLPPMATWMMEAQATLAEEVVGHAISGRGPGRDYGFRTAFNPDGTDPVDWYRSAFVDLAHYFGFGPSNAGIEGAPDRCGWLGADPSPCHGRALWYGVGWSFLRWVSDTYGPDRPGGEAELQAALVDDPRSGFEALAALTGRSREELLARWSAALYVDGRVEGLDDELSFGSWDLYEIFDMNLLESARLRPPVRSFADFRDERAVRSASTAYLRLEGSGRPAATLRIAGADGGELSDEIQAWVVRLR